MQHVEHAFIGRDAAADREDHQRNDQRPEVKLFAATEGMVLVRRLFAFVHPQQQQAAVARVNDRVNAFGNHRRAAGESRGAKLRHGNCEVADDCGIDGFIRLGHRSFAQIDQSQAGLLVDFAAEVARRFCQNDFQRRPDMGFENVPAMSRPVRFADDHMSVNLR